MPLNLRGRVPKIMPTTSNGLIYAGAALVVLMIVVIVWGFHWRLVKEEARKHATNDLIAASDAAESNRVAVRGGSVTPVSLPVSNPAKPPATTGTTLPHNPIPMVPVSQSYGLSDRDDRQSPEDAIKAQDLAHEYERRRAAMEAPTGAAKNQSQPVTPPLDAYQQEMAKINALPGQQQPNAAQPARAELEDGPNGQGQKRQFGTSSEEVADDYLKTTRVAPLSRWVVEKGDVIPAMLSTRLVSDLPGDLIAEVKRDVYDTPTHKYVMIPAGSLLAGEYNSQVTYGQDRVQVAWTYLRFPDGSYIDLARFPGQSADGSAGLHDQVDHHYKRLIGGIALSSLFAAGIQISQNRTNGGANGVLTYPSNAQVASAAVAQQAATVGEQITSQNLRVQPTVKIRVANNFEVNVKKTMVFRGPYQAIKFE